MGINGQHQIHQAIERRPNKAIKFPSKRTILIFILHFSAYLTATLLGSEEISWTIRSSTTRRFHSRRQSTPCADKWFAISAQTWTMAYLLSHHLHLSFLAGGLIKDVGEMAFATVLSVLHGRHEHSSAALFRHQLSQYNIDNNRDSPLG